MNAFAVGVRRWFCCHGIAIAVSGLPAQAAAGPEAAGAVAVAVAAGRTAGVVGEALPFTIVLDFDETYVRTHGLPLVQRAVDVPFVIAAPWLQAGDDTVAVEEVEGPRVVTAGAERAWRRAPGSAAGRGRLELPCRVQLRRAGEIALAPVVVRFAYATAFEEDFLRGRQPVDRREDRIEAAPPPFVARDLPPADVPGFTGAVGVFAVRAAAAPTAVEVGDECSLELVVAGSGDLAAFAPPPWPVLPGFVVQGLAESRLPGERRFRFDALVVRADAPPPRLPFAFFDPVAGRYVAAVAEVNGLAIRPRSAGRPLSPRAEKLVAAAAAAESTGLGAWWWAITAGLLLPVLPLVLWRRRRRG